MRQPATAKTSSGARRAAFHATALTPLLALGAAAAKLLSGVAWLQHRYEAATDIAYAEGEQHKLDVYRPRGSAGAPVIVFFYGGKWQSGTKEMYGFLAAALTARGYVVVIPDYRLYPEVRFPDFIADGAKALRWTRDNIAAFAGDASALFVMGHSAGSYIAAMLALDRQWLADVGLDAGRDIAGLIGVSGPYDFLPLRDQDLIAIFGGDNRPVTQPIFYAEGRKPPALILTGADDRTVAPGNSTRLSAKLRRGGNDVTERVYPRLGHFTVLAGFTPLVAPFLSPQRDLDAFVARIRSRRLGERQSPPAHAAGPAP
jgi:acetyl esterase/lipase